MSENTRCLPPGSLHLAGRPPASSVLPHRQGVLSHGGVVSPCVCNILSPAAGRSGCFLVSAS